MNATKHVARVVRTGLRNYEVRVGESLLCSPERSPITFGSKWYAGALCKEWNTSVSKTKITTMPLLCVAFTAADRIHRDAAISTLVNHLANDSLLYGETSYLDQVVAALPFRCSPTDARVNPGGAFEIAQVTDILRYEFSDWLRTLSNLQIASMQIAGQYTKSVLASAACLSGGLSASQAITAAFHEELSQQGRWGTVEGDHDVSLAESRMWLAAARVSYITGGLNV